MSNEKNNMKQKNDYTVLSDFIDSLTKNLDPNLTIGEAKEYFIANLSRLYEESKTTQKALLFSVCAKEQKGWCKFFTALGLKTYTEEKWGEIALEGLKHVHYHLILINVDSIFNELDQMLRYIRSEDSKNKDSYVFLVTSHEEHLSKLEEMHFDKKTILLSERKKIEKTKEVENAPA